jgi:hypothetical protein
MVCMAHCHPPASSYGASRLRIAVMTWSFVQPPAAARATCSCSAPSGSIERYRAIRSSRSIFASWWIRPGCQASATGAELSIWPSMLTRLACAATRGQGPAYPFTACAARAKLPT